MAYFITQLIYIQPGAEQVLDQFEALAIPLIAAYNGSLLLRLRPGTGAALESNMEVPYELHFVRFETEEDFTRFTADPQRRKFLHLKESAIRSSLIVGGKLI